MNQLSNKNFRIEIADEQTLAFNGQRLIDAVEMILHDHEFLEAEISIAVVDDPAIREINRNYLGHDYETDVISFALDEDRQRSFLSGQLVVSSDTALRVAAELKTTLDDELLMYVVHGTLHLVGLDDVQPELAAKMREAEKDCLNRMGVTHRWADEPDDNIPNSQREAEY